MTTQLRIARRTVSATVRVPGFHQWPAAPEPVQYLRAKHRHMFTMRAEFDVTHDERDVEFHMAQGWLQEALRKCYGEAPHDFASSSCETIAHVLAQHLVDDGRPAPCAFEVHEDDENGARVQFYSGLGVEA